MSSRKAQSTHNLVSQIYVFAIEILTRCYEERNRDDNVETHQLGYVSEQNPK